MPTAGAAKTGGDNIFIASVKYVCQIYVTIYRRKPIERRMELYFLSLFFFLLLFFGGGLFHTGPRMAF